MTAIEVFYLKAWVCMFPKCARAGDGVWWPSRDVGNHRILQSAIQIISVGHADLMIGDEDAKYGTLMVCFSHGNHYDLVLTQERVQRLAFAQVCNKATSRARVVFCFVFARKKLFLYMNLIDFKHDRRLCTTY